MKPIHTYERDERAAKVYNNSNGFYVELWESGKLVETRDCSEHSESWAESVAENYVDKMYDAEHVHQFLDWELPITPPRTLKNDVEITVKLQFKNQYSGDGETEPTREQVRKALIHHAENNLWYEEIRTPVKEERDAFDVHNDLVSGKLEKNAYLLHEEPVSNPLETFNDIDEAIETAKQMQQDISESERLQADLEPISKDIPQSHTNKLFTSRQTLGRASKEQGGDREQYIDNANRDPFNE